MKINFLSCGSSTFCFRSLWKLICVPICLSLTACGGGGFIISSVFAVLILAAIGDGLEEDDGNKGNPAPASALAVTNLTAIPSETGIRLGWTNPDRDNINAFNISRQEIQNPTTQRFFLVTRAEPMNVNFAREATTSFLIGGLDTNTRYNLGVLVMYADGSTAQSTEILAATGINSDNDSEIDFFDKDDDNDGVEDDADNCRLVANADQTNTDNASDGGDACDVDDDNDGLIEIRTTEELNNIRYNLAGTGYMQAAGAAANSAGCPAGSGCNGYELTENISLAGDDWLPIGGDDDPFTADFDGNGNVLSDVAITNEQNVLGNRTYIGFFARVMEASIKNLGMVMEELSAEETPGGTYFGGLSGSINNTEIVNSYIIFSDVLSIEDEQPGTFFGGLSGLADNTTVERFYVVLPNNISVQKNLTEPGTRLTIGGMFGDNGEGGMRGTSSLSNSYVIYRGDPAITATTTTDQNLTATINGFGTDNVRVENSYAFFAGSLPVATPAINLTLSILPGSSSVHNSYFNARTDTDDPRHRTSEQLHCPTGPNANCDGMGGNLTGTDTTANTTYAGWDTNIWEFGDNRTLPTLIGLPSCPPDYASIGPDPDSDCRFGSPLNP